MKLFWLLLVASGFMVLEIPATISQLTGVLPILFPVWYSLCRMGVDLIRVGITVGWYRSTGNMSFEQWERRRKQAFN
jgi:hypothetical protein